LGSEHAERGHGAIGRSRAGDCCAAAEGGQAPAGPRAG
jgi:hypothetical protein